MEPFVPEPLPPANLDLEALVPAIGRASRALGSYSGSLQPPASPGVLLAPMALREAVFSSRIEGTQATLSDVLKSEAGEPPRSASRAGDVEEVLNYQRALRAAEAAIAQRPFSLSVLKGLHQLLLHGVRGAEKSPGAFRTAQNWIGVEGRLESPSFVPPRPETVAAHMDGWMEFYASVQPDPLVQLALVHAQFEIIHPFMDGNGRLGRILVPIFLAEKKLLPSPAFYLSAWLEERRSEYCQALRELGRSAGAWNAWVEFFLRGVAEQARDNEQKVKGMLALHRTMRDRALEATRSVYVVPLLDEVFARPIFKLRQLELGAKAPSLQTLTSLVQVLCELKILRRIRAGGPRKPALYACPELLNLCEGRRVI